MKDDPVVEQIRKIRKDHALRFDNDLDKIFLSIKEKEKKYKTRLINRDINNKIMKTS